MSDKDIGRLKALAAECGFDCSAPLSPFALEFLPEVRDMCAANTCGKYGASWSCPPACGTLEELREKALRYSEGLLVQTVGRLEDSFDWEGITAAERIHRERFLKMWDALEGLYPGLMAMGTGACTLCERCTYPDAPCRFPARVAPSMEACGLVVSSVCKSCGVPYNHGRDTIAYTGCFLF